MQHYIPYIAFSLVLFLVSMIFGRVFVAPVLEFVSGFNCYDTDLGTGMASAIDAWCDNPENM